MGRFTGLLGLAVILAAAWLMSNHKRHIQARIIAWGLGLQCLFAFLVLKTPLSEVLRKVSDGVAAMFGFAEAGSTFVFGTLGSARGPGGFDFAFQVLPIIIFIASFFSILYYLGIMQHIVRAMAVAMQKIMGVSGAEALNVAASIFMGQTEAPLTIKPFIAGMTESELFTIMTCGMAHVSGAVMALYVLSGHVEIRHLLTAVIMTAPATIMLAKLIVPEVGKPATAGTRGDQDRKDRGERDRCRRAGRGRRAAVDVEHRGDADRVPGADCDGQWNFEVGPRICGFRAGVP